MSAGDTNPDDTAATIRKTVNEVNVVFTVTDKHGHYVKNLNKEPDKELLKALTDYEKQVDDVSNKLGRSSEQSLGLPGGARVTERLGQLFGSIDNYNGAPTAAQRTYFEELQPEFRRRMEEVNAFISNTIPQWNDKLRGWNAPTLTTRKPIEF